MATLISVLTGFAGIAGSDDLRPLYVTSIQTNPFLIRAADGTLSGFVVDLAALLSRETNRKFELHLVRDGRYGSYDLVHDRWDGMVGEVINASADLAMAPLTITDQRMGVVDFSLPFMSSGLTAIVAKPRPVLMLKRTTWWMVGVFAPSVWLAIALVFLLCGIGLWVVARFSTSLHDQVFNLSDSYWFLAAGFLHQYAGVVPKSHSARLIAVGWWCFCTLLMFVYFVAILIVVRSSHEITPAVDKIYDLGFQTVVKYGVQRHGSTEQFFSTSDDPLIKQMYAWMKANPEVFTKTYDEGIKRVREHRGTYAFILEDSVNKFINSRKPCDTVSLAGAPLNTLDYGIAVKKGSPMKQTFDEAIAKLKTNGKLSQLINEWWEYRSECPRLDDVHSVLKENKEQMTILTMDELLGTFMLILGFICISVCAGCLEFCCRCSKTRKLSNRGRKTIREVISDHLHRDVHHV